MAKAPESGPNRPFVFLHIGDLHLVAPDRRDSPALKRLKRRLAEDVTGLFREIAAIQDGAFDFVFLPGDIADDGTAVQYAILRDALKAHPVRTLHLIPGDHDRQHGKMSDFERFRATTGLPAPIDNTIDMDGSTVPLRQYYYPDTINGVRCLFLDMVSAGHGRKGIGLDFRLGKTQAAWFAEEVGKTLGPDGTPKIPCAVFMHTYPADLQVRSEAADAAGVIWNGHVRLVEMGHTHYNEITPDGRTHYAAARSVGQNEDGSTGYAVCALDGDVVSWRFKAADKDWPFVLITSPADRRVATTGHDGPDTIALRALVLTARAGAKCRFRVDDGFWKPMDPPGPGDRCFTASVLWPDGARRITVEAWHVGDDGETVTSFDRDEVEPAGTWFQPRPRPPKIGSDDLHLPAWPAKGLRGDQLGPNRAGRDW